MTARKKTTNKGTNNKPVHAGDGNGHSEAALVSDILPLPDPRFHGRIGSTYVDSKADIKHFCESKFDVTFPLADKQVVVGDKAHPLYRWAAKQTGALGVPSWNFHKILIGRDGRVIEWFSAAGGTGPKLDRAIEAALDNVRS